jgi:predicted porin
MIMLGLVIAAPLGAQADEGSITLYGQALLSVDVVDDGEDTVNNIANRDSRFGVKGKEPLGNGINAIFQFEVQAELDDGGPTFFSGGRKSYVGLAGGFGAFTLGIVDSPHRESTDPIDVFGNSLADHNTIIGNVGDGDTSAEFNNRNVNTLNYWSPNYDGFQFKAQYGVDEDPDVDEDRYGVSGVYTNGPLYATIAYEVHQEERGDNDTDGIKVGVAYAFNAEKTRVGFIYDRISEDDASTTFDRDAYYVNISHKLDNNTLKAGYARANESDAAVGDDGADFYFAGVSHKLSKRTEVFALYATVDNDENGDYALGSSTNGATPGADLGERISGISLGIGHKF